MAEKCRGMKKCRGKKEWREREERDSATHFDSRIKKIDRKNREVGQGHPARLWSIPFRLSRINLDQRCVIRRAHENGSRVIAVTRNGPFRRVSEKERERKNVSRRIRPQRDYVRSSAKVRPTVFFCVGRLIHQWSYNNYNGKPVRKEEIDQCRWQRRSALTYAVASFVKGIPYLKILPTKYSDFSLSICHISHTVITNDFAQSEHVQILIYIFLYSLS